MSASFKLYNAQNNLKDFVDGKLRDKSLMRILQENSSCYSFLTKDEYKGTEEEFEFLKKYLIRTSSSYAAKLYNNDKITLSDDERKDIEFFVLTDSYACFTMLCNKKFLNTPEYRRELLDSLMFDVSKTGMFISQKHSTLEDRLYIVNNSEVEDLKTIYNHLRVYDDEARMICFSKLADDINWVEYIIECNTTLTFNELLILHDLHWTYFYTKFSKNYKKYFSYCSYFKKCLSYLEQQTLIKMLMKENNKYKIETIGNSYDFFDDMKEMINGYLLAYKLSAN